MRNDKDDDDEKWSSTNARVKVAVILGIILVIMMPFMLVPSMSYGM